jgi:hypothetical protein
LSPGPGTSFSPVKDAWRVASGAATTGTAVTIRAVKASAASKVGYLNTTSLYTSFLKRGSLR